MPITITSIAFNWDDTARTADAINMRMDYGTAIQVPEYCPGALRDQPSAYVTSEIGADGVQIRAAFAGGTPGATVTISAIGNGTPLGNVAATPVVFGPDGSAAAVTFNLANTTFAGAPINACTTTWTWTALEGEVETEIGETAHLSYILPNLPVAPWVQTAGSTSLPWAEALEKACAWAAGRDGADAGAIASALTSGINACGATYDPAAKFYDPGVLVAFNLTSYLIATNAFGFFGLAFTMNCLDCANAVATFAQLLGVPYVSGSIVPTEPPPPLETLATNPIRGLGTLGWQEWDWSYHQVCWDNYLETGHVYDASAWLDNSTVAGFLSLGLQYDTVYRPALVKSGNPILPLELTLALR
jgi:hypothetical protein